MLSAFGRVSRVPGLLILLPVLILMLPWFQSDDDLSGQPPIGFFFLFVLGFLLLGDDRIGRVIDRHWVWILCLGWPPASPTS